MVMLADDRVANIHSQSDCCFGFLLFIPFTTDNPIVYVIINIWFSQASRFLLGDWASGLGSESGFLCQGYPVILYILTVSVIISINIIINIINISSNIIILNVILCREQQY